MKRILWFSNCIQSSGANKASGSWLYSMARLLTGKDDIFLTNITISRSIGTQKPEYIKIKDNFEEYILPNWQTDKDGKPSKQHFGIIKDIVTKSSPDIIHIWGVERYYSKVLPSLGLNIPTLLEIQGLHCSCVDVYYGDMSIRDTLRCFGMREILFPFKKSLYRFKNDIRRRGEQEIIAIKQFKYISTQSRWIRDYIRTINNDARLFNTGMSLRQEFWNSKKWEYPTDGSKNFYASSAGATPYKSIQTAIKALAEVVKIHPDTKLYIVGNFKDTGWLQQPGYQTFVKKTIKRLGVERNVIFTGAQDATGIIETMHKCLGAIQTSYVESYSLVVAEAQSIGLPCIISYAGAMPELAEERKSGLFYSPGDYRSCAGRMLELIENKELALTLSENSYKLAYERNNDKRVLNIQLNIYEEIIKTK